jgi:hypothetical protein
MGVYNSRRKPIRIDGMGYISAINK